MVSIFEQVFILILFIVIGYILAKTKKIDSSQSKILSSLCVSAFFPCTLFNTFSTKFTVEYITTKYHLLTASICVLIGVVIFVKFFARLLDRDDYHQKIYRYSLTVPNAGYMGIALASALFDSDTLLNFMVFSIPVSFYTYTEGYRMLTNTGKISLKRIINPPTIAIFIGAAVGLLGIEVPEIVTSITTKSSNCIAPVSMLLAGIVISDYKIIQIVKRPAIYIVSIMRLLILPFAICFILSRFCSKEIVTSAALYYSMPCGLNTIVFPKLVGKNCDIGAGLALISHILALITIPICLNFLI